MVTQPLVRPIKVVTAVMGLDGHDRGVKVVTHAFSVAGMETIYLGIRQTAIQVAEAVLQEDADVVGLSVHSGNFEILKRLVRELKIREVNLDEVLLLVGGVIPEREVAELKDAGYNYVFGPGSSTEEIVRVIKEWAKSHPK